MFLTAHNIRVLDWRGPSPRQEGTRILGHANKKPVKFAYIGPGLILHDVRKDNADLRSATQLVIWLVQEVAICFVRAVDALRHRRGERHEIAHIGVFVPAGFCLVGVFNREGNAVVASS